LEKALSNLLRGRQIKLHKGLLFVIDFEAFIVHFL
jgi:hypothetical protein